MKNAESILSKNDDIENSSEDEEGARRNTYQDKELMFNSENIGEDRKWLFNLLLSDTESDSEISDQDKYIGEMLKDHVREKRYRQKYHQNPNVSISPPFKIQIYNENHCRMHNTAITVRACYPKLTCIQSNSNPSWEESVAKRSLTRNQQRRRRSFRSCHESRRKIRTCRMS